MRDTSQLCHVQRHAARLLNCSIGEDPHHTLAIVDQHLEHLITEMIGRLSGAEHTALIAMAEVIAGAVAYEVESALNNPHEVTA